MAKYRLEFAKKQGATMWGGFSKYPGCATTFGPYRTRTGRYYTGLSEGDVKRLAKATGIEEICLMPPSDVENTPKLGSFWKTWVVSLSTRGVDIDTTDPYDEIKYLFLKNHHWVADGSNNVNSSHKFVLLNVDAEAIKKNENNKKRREAFREIDKMSTEQMRRALRVMGIMNRGKSNEVVESELHDIVEKNVDKFIRVWINNKDRDIQEQIDMALDYNVIRQAKNMYYYETTTIGHSLEDTIAWWKDLDNKQIVDAINSAVKLKQKI